MNATQQIPVVSSDAGDKVALANPNSPASLMKKSKELEAQSSADMKYDATAPPPEGFQNCDTEYHETVNALLLAASVLLLLYAGAPN